MWNFKFHGALSLRLVASNPPFTPEAAGSCLCPFRAVAALVMFTAAALFCDSAAPADKDQRAALYSGLFINWRAMSACVSSALGPGSAGAFSRFVLQRKKRDRCLWLGNGLSYAQPSIRGTGGWTRLVVKSIFLVRTHTAIKFFNAIQFFLCSSTGTQLLVSSLQIISGD